ncbi:thiamine pyrophosphate-binding protein [Nocardia terpenica]|nr:thiamine pyrophosphate-binding protein [Nocardia terpenica]NQE87039.1 thiamine pyrophosphate-binding protein [Nocardia terpenica]
MQLCTYIYRRLHERGIRYAFGVPGSFVMPIWQEFSQAPEIVLARQETGAVFMADGWARATGRLGVAVATIGPGLTNCVTGVASAYRDSVPLLVLTGQAPTATFGRGAFLESYVLDRSVSPGDLFGPITKASMEIVDLANARFQVDTAIDLALAGRPGPVHLSVPFDLQETELPEEQAPPGLEASEGPGIARIGGAPGEALSATAAALTRARRPLILAGWGSVLSGAMEAVAELAVMVDAPVVSTTKSVSCLPGDHPLFLGHLGPGQRPDLVSTLRDYDPDTVLVLGASMSAYYTQPIGDILKRAFVIRVDIEAEQLQLRQRPQVAVHADVSTATTALAAILKGEGDAPSGTASSRTFVREFQERGRAAVAAQATTFGDSVSMSGVVARLAELLPATAVVVPDAGNHWLDTLSLFRAPLAGGLQLNCGLGAMGWAIGASIGMALARPDIRTVCVTGDGSILMHGCELSVAAERGANLLVVVFNNRSHARVRIHQQNVYAGDIRASDISDIDFTRWLQAMGIPTFGIDGPDDVETGLRAALATPGVVGVEVKCHPDEVPAGLRDWIGASA